MRSFQASLKSSRRCWPSHIALVPGSPSVLRPRNPPRLASIRVYWRRVGGVPSTTGRLVMNVANAFHSSSSQKTVQGTSGVSRPRVVRCLRAHRSPGRGRPKASRGHTWICPGAASGSLRQNALPAARGVRELALAVGHGFLERRRQVEKQRWTTSGLDCPRPSGLVRREPAASARGDLARPSGTIRRYRLPDLPCSPTSCWDSGAGLRQHSENCAATYSFPFPRSCAVCVGVSCQTPLRPVPSTEHPQGPGAYLPP